MVWRSAYTAAIGASAKPVIKEELHTSEFDERKKGWKRCECPIFASGTLSGKRGGNVPAHGNGTLHGQ